MNLHRNRPAVFALVMFSTIMVQAFLLLPVAQRYRPTVTGSMDFAGPMILVLVTLASLVAWLRGAEGWCNSLMMASVGGLCAVTARFLQGAGNSADFCTLPASGPAQTIARTAWMLPCGLGCLFPLTRPAFTTATGLLGVSVRLIASVAGMLLAPACLGPLLRDSEPTPAQMHWAMVLGMAMGAALGLKCAALIESAEANRQQPAALGRILAEPGKRPGF